MNKERLGLHELEPGLVLVLPHGGSVIKRFLTDKYGSRLTCLIVDNGRLRISVLPERGMEIGGIWLDGELMSWERGSSYLLHPEHADLQGNGGMGWLDGFYSAAASIGPELFGTPGEGYTLHGTASYSAARENSVSVSYDGEGIRIEGTVLCAGYAPEAVFDKEINLCLGWGSSVLLREESTRNVSDRELTLDDGYHIQLSGPFLHGGGRYVLPADKRDMLLRDGAPPEDDPFRISARDEGPQPIRCYQYVPRPVAGLESVEGLQPYMNVMSDDRMGMTAEMVIDCDNNAAGFVVRPLSCFPRSLIAKEIADSFMFAIEPCRTRPNRMSQKHTDGEAFTLAPQAVAVSRCLIGVTKDKETMTTLEALIMKA